MYDARSLETTEVKSSHVCSASCEDLRRIESNRSDPPQLSHPRL